MIKPRYKELISNGFEQINNGSLIRADKSIIVATPIENGRYEIIYIANAKNDVFERNLINETERFSHIKNLVELIDSADNPKKPKTGLVSKRFARNNPYAILKFD